MAQILNFKCPSEKFLSYVEKSDLQRILKPSIESVAKQIESNNTLFAYDVPAELRKALAEIGVPLHPIPFLSHSHPFSKMLENHILFNVLAGQIDGGWIFSSIKEGKVTAFVSRKKKCTVDVVNRFICAKDLGRYDVNKDSSICQKFYSDKPNVLPVKFINRCKRRNVFIHDEVHHWQLSDMFKFLREAEPTRFCFTIVYPVEILNGIMESQNPKMYTFRDAGSSKILFYPDGKASEGYEQEANLNWLFRAAHFQDGDKVWTVKRLYSAYSHHLFEVIPGSFVTDSVRVFNDFKTIDFSRIQESRFLMFNHIPIRKDLVERVYSYLLCLKKPDMESALAKLRQIMGDDSDVRVQLFFKRLVVRFLENKNDFNLFDIKWTERFKSYLIEIFPKWLVNNLSTWKGKNLFMFLMELKNLEIEVECITIKPSFKYENFKVMDVSVHQVNHAYELLESFHYGKGFENNYPTCYDNSKFSSRRPISSDPFKEYAFSCAKPITISGVPRLAIDDDTWARMMEDFVFAETNPNACMDCFPGFMCSPCKKEASMFLKIRVKIFWQMIRVYVKLEGDGEAVIEEFQDLLSEFRAKENFKRTFFFDSNLNLPKGSHEEKESEFNNGSNDHDDDEANPNSKSNEDSNPQNFDNEQPSQQADESGNADSHNCEERHNVHMNEDQSQKTDEQSAYDGAEENKRNKGNLNGANEKPFGDDNGEDCFTDDNFEPEAHVCPFSLDDSRVVIDVPGDGDCFFHSLKGAFNLDYSVSELRAHMANVLSDFGHINASDFILNGGWPTGWMIKCLIDANPGIKLCIHQLDVQGLQFKIHADHIPGEIAPRDGCIVKLSQDHYGFIKSVTKADSLVRHSDWDPTLFLSEIENLKALNMKGRKAIFFSKSKKIDYGHNGVKYMRENWPESLNAVVDEMGMDVNACLFQVYEEGAKIGFHKDNEKVYGSSPIYTINFGSALFEFDNGVSFELKNGDCVKMHGDYLKKHRHRITSLQHGRFSLTFRKHFRSMNGSPLDELHKHGLGRNKCLIKAIACGLEKDVLDVAEILSADPELNRLILSDELMPTNSLETICELLKINVELSNLNSSEVEFYGDESDLRLLIVLELIDDHITIASKVKPEKMQGDFNNHASSGFKTSGGRFSSEDSNKCEMSEFLNSMESIKYVAESGRAEILRKCLLNGTTGVTLDEVFNKGARFLDFPFIHDEYCTEIRYVAGFPGCGKSHNLCSFLKKQNVKPESIAVISPRVELAKEWKQNLGISKRNCVFTFEVALKHRYTNLEVIVIDELGLYPPGYLDLLILKAAHENFKGEIVVLFDPLQSRYDSESDRAYLPNLNDMDKLISDGTIDYLYETRRFKSEKMLSLFEGISSIPRQSDHKFRVFQDLLEMKNDPIGSKVETILTSSFAEKALFANSFEVMTFGQSQGINRRVVCVLLSDDSVLSDDHRWFVALTRASEDICFLIKHLNGLEGFLAQTEGRLINGLLNNKVVTKKRLTSMVGCRLNLIKYAKGGRDEVDREERLDGDLFLKGYIYLGQRICLEEPECVEPIVTKEHFRTHFFHGQANFANAINFDNIRAKEFREFRSGSSTTEQFTDNYEKVSYGSKKKTAGPLRFEAIYPRHKADDDMTFWMAVHKRLKFSDPIKERMKLSGAWTVGMILLERFLEKTKLNFTWDQNLFDECVNDFEEKKLSKSKAMLANHCIRSDIDWDPNYIFLFMKSQLCTKFEKQYCDAKAGQTLACFQHLVLVMFAPYCRYMEKQIRSQLPEEIYIHSNKNFNDLNEWVIKMGREGMAVESDYEAFDASQDQYILAFEVLLMKKMHIPNVVVDAYIDMKTHLGCKLGSFAIMRFTGEFCTFLFNTLANMAFTFCRYDWTSGQPILFAGDDMCSLEKINVIEDFDAVLNKVSLKAKVAVTETPMFCGWRLSKHGIVKEPELVYNRFMVAVERGNVDECLENYAIECSYAYSLGERLYEVLKSEEQFEYHQQVIRFIVQNLSKLRTSVKELYHEQSDEDLC
ncbi:replicase [Karelinia prunevirus A]|nr:replicase [Karelinia prunevirus A]